VFTGSVILDTRVHGPCSRAVNTTREHGRHFGHPCSRVVNTVLGVHYPRSRAVITTREHGRHLWKPVNRGHPDGQALLL